MSLMYFILILEMRELILERDFLIIVKICKVLVMLRNLFNIIFFRFWGNRLNIMNMVMFFMVRLFLLYVRVFI